MKQWGVGLALGLMLWLPATAQSQTWDRTASYSLASHNGQMESLLTFGLHGQQDYALPLSLGSQLSVFADVFVELKDALSALANGQRLAIGGLGGQIGVGLSQPVSWQLAPGLSLEGFSAEGAWRVQMNAQGNGISQLSLSPISVNFDLRIGVLPVKIGAKIYVNQP